jgi:hypothetical protein
MTHGCAFADRASHFLAKRDSESGAIATFLEKSIEKRETRGICVDVRVNIEAAPADGEDAKAANARIVVQQQLSIIGQHIVALETDAPPTATE